jgi:multiple sugar transport system permease protein
MIKKPWVAWVVLALVSALFLVPFWLMLSLSLQPLASLLNGQWQWWPNWLDWRNYARLFETVPMATYGLNSLLVTLTTTVCHVLVAAMAGYAFARLPFRGKTLLFLGCLLTMMIPPQVNLVPLFLLMKQLHAIDSLWALILPGVFGAFGVFLLRQWFLGFPTALEDAACLDGCSPWQTFWHVALPTAKPALATLAVFVFIATWNSFLWPLIVIQSDALRTLPVGIAALKGSFRDVMDWPVLLAAATVSVTPVLVVFAVAQRAFVQGIMSGGVKE